MIKEVKIIRQLIAKEEELVQLAEEANELALAALEMDIFNIAKDSSSQIARSRYNAAKENFIEEIKNRPESSYIHDLHTKAEYLEAYKTILHETKKLRGIV